IWRMRADGSAQEQITNDQYNNWFPHVSPDGQSIVFLSFMKDVAPDDHPFYKQVYLRMMRAAGGTPHVVGYVYGGQGAANVPPRGSGRAGAFVYHARRFVEGTTLRAWLANHGEMPLRRVIEVLRDVLLALAHAHRGSIAHGDLRPENVLLTAGRVQVADTG